MKRRSSISKSLLRWTLAVSLGAAQTAHACAFHGYTPNPTIVDLLLNTEQAVIAQRDPAGAGRYVALETLLGPVADEITLTGTTTAPGTSVLLARDGAYGPWQKLAVLDDDYRQAIRQIMQRQSGWQLGQDRDRLAFFAKLLNAPSPALRRLALQELDRVPYADLRSTRLPAVQNLRADLTQGETDLRPIRILLAGLSSDRSFAALLPDMLQDAVQQDVAYLGAYATALIEQSGKEAVQTLVDRYLKSGAVSLQSKEKLLQALALQHKTAPRATRRAITAQLADLLRTHPALKDMAARQFAFAATSGPTARSAATQGDR